MRDGSDRVVATSAVLVSQPVYVVWTLDFEGDAATDDALANTLAISRAQAGAISLPFSVSTYSGRSGWP